MNEVSLTTEYMEVSKGLSIKPPPLPPMECVLNILHILLVEMCVCVPVPIGLQLLDASTIHENSEGLSFATM